MVDVVARNMRVVPLEEAEDIILTKAVLLYLAVFVIGNPYCQVVHCF